jgi:hypothetical protein
MTTIWTPKRLRNAIDKIYDPSKYIAIQTDIGNNKGVADIIAGKLGISFPLIFYNFLFKKEKDIKPVLNAKPLFIMFFKRDDLNMDCETLKTFDEEVKKDEQTK